MYVRIVAVGLIVLAIVGGSWYVRNLQETVQELTAANTLLNQTVANQNKAVDTLKKDADARVAASKTAIEVARAETKKAKAKATIIYKTLPSTPDDDCKSSLDLINEQLLSVPTPVEN